MFESKVKIESDQFLINKRQMEKLIEKRKELLKCKEDLFCSVNSSICLKKGLLVILTEKYNVRILPPLNVKINEIKEAIEIFTIALEQINE